MSDLEFTTVDGLEVAYRCRGAGPTLILLHAFPLNMRMWEAQLAGLAEVAHVVAPDLPGFGASQATDGQLSIEALGDWVHAFALRLGHLRYVVGGLSMGGYIALALARRHQEALRGLILADTQAGADSPEARARRFTQAEEVRARGMSGLAASLPGHLLSPATVARGGAVRDAVAEMISQARPATVEGCLAALARRPDQTDLLPVLRVPTLVVVGEADAITPPAVAVAMAAAIPGAALVRVPNAGHLSALEEPAAFNSAVAAFLSHLAR